jgi:hypothetical protein
MKTPIEKIMTAFGNAKRKPIYYEKTRENDRRHFGVVVLLVVFGLLEIGSAAPRNPVPEQLQYLEEPDRSEWQMPERVIDAGNRQRSKSFCMLGGRVRRLWTGEIVDRPQVGNPSRFD